jgi:hypothetical protein
VPEAVALGEPGPSTRLHSVESQQTIAEDLTQEERDELELHGCLSGKLTRA